MCSLTSRLTRSRPPHPNHLHLYSLELVSPRYLALNLLKSGEYSYSDNFQINWQGTPNSCLDYKCNQSQIFLANIISQELKPNNSGKQRGDPRSLDMGIKSWISEHTFEITSSCRSLPVVSVICLSKQIYTS